MNKLLARKSIDGYSRNISEAQINIRKISGREEIRTETVETSYETKDMDWLEYLKFGDLISFRSKWKEMTSTFLHTSTFFSPIFFILILTFLMLDVCF